MFDISHCVIRLKLPYFESWLLDEAKLYCWTV